MKGEIWTMNKKLAIIHTTPVTIDTFKDLTNELMPEVTVVNLLDDSILPQLIQNGGDLDSVRSRWFAYGKIAKDIGADVILSACSSVGGLADELNEELDIPVLRIDEAMAEAAVDVGDEIGVAATLKTTLGPTISLLEDKAKAVDKKIEIKSALADEAYKRLMQGDGEGHDKILAKELYDLAQKVDVVVLAQASMARVLDTFPDEIKDKFLISPRLGIMRTKKVLESIR